MVEAAVDATFSKRAKPEDTPALFGKFFSQLASSARDSRINGAVSWKTVKKDVVDGVFATDRPADPVRAAAYTTATILLQKISDDTSPADQLRYSNLYASSCQASGVDSSTSTVAALAVAGAAAAAAAAAESAPWQGPHVAPGPPPDPTGPVGSIAFKSSLVAEAFPAVAVDLGPPGAPPGLDKCPAALSMNYMSSPAPSEFGEIGSIVQESDWLEHIALPDDDAAASAPLVLGGKGMDVEEDDFLTKSSDDCAAQLPPAGVSLSLGAEQPSCTRSESPTDDIPRNDGSENITNSCGSNGLHTASTSSTPTPTAQVAAGGAAPAEMTLATAAALGVPSMRPQSSPASACGTGKVATQANQTASIASGTAAAGLGAAAVGPPHTLADHCRQAMASFGIDAPSLFQTATGKSTVATEAGVVAAATLEAVGVAAPVPGAAAALAGNMAPPKSGKPQSDSGASVGGSGGAPESGVSELSGTNGNAPTIASGSSSEQVAGGLGVETRPTTPEVNLPNSQQSGVTFPYGTPVPVVLPMTACGVQDGFAGEGGVPVPESMPTPVPPPVAAAEMAGAAGPESAASGLSEPIMYGSIDPFASLTPEAEQAAMAAMREFDPVDYLNRKLAKISESTNRDLANFFTMDPNELSLLGDVDGVPGPMTNPDKPQYFGETMTKDSPGGDAPITAELDMSMYGGGGGGGSGDGGGGGGSGKKRKADSSDGNDCAGGANKKVCSASVAGDTNASTYSGGGGGGGSCNKRTGGGSDGYNYVGAPNNKVCCV